MAQPDGKYNTMKDIDYEIKAEKFVHCFFCKRALSFALPKDMVCLEDMRVKCSESEYFTREVGYGAECPMFVSTRR
jgi:hypothetical protein